MPVTPKVGYRLSAETRERITKLAGKKELTNTEVVQQAVREMAEREGVVVRQKKSKKPV